MQSFTNAEIPQTRPISSVPEEFIELRQQMLSFTKGLILGLVENILGDFKFVEAGINTDIERRVSEFIVNLDPEKYVEGESLKNSGVYELIVNLLVETVGLNRESVKKVFIAKFGAEEWGQA